MGSDRNYYEILGVLQSVDSKSLRKAFHRLSKDLHPDTTSLPVDEAAKKFQKVYEAYELLSDPVLRQAYDKEINNINLKTHHSEQNTFKTSLSSSKTVYSVDSRRPLSGGELFSLLLLFIAIFLSLLLGIGFALLEGRELQVTPSWLVIEYPLPVLNLKRNKNDTIAFSSHSFKSAFFSRA